MKKTIMILVCAALLMMSLPVYSQALTEEDLVIVDEHENFSNVLYRTPNIAVTTSNPERYDGDNSRFYKLNHEEAYFIYEAPKAATHDVHQFEIVTWYAANSNGELPGDMSFQISEDNEVYVPLAGVQRTVDDWVHYNWRKIIWTSEALPVGTNYVKIVFGDTTNHSAAWPIQVGKTTLIIRENYLGVLQQKIEEAQDLLNGAVVGEEPGMYPQTAVDAFASVVASASAVADAPESTSAELEAAYNSLVQAQEKFELSMLLVLNWDPLATIEATGAGLDWISISWPAVREAAQHPQLAYDVYLNGSLAGTTTDTWYTAEGLKPQFSYAFYVVARSGEESSRILGPVNADTAPLAQVPAPDFSLIDLADFSDEDYLAPKVWTHDSRGIPYYFTHFHQVANAVRLEEPYRGFIDIVVHRQPAYNKPFNARVQENHLWLAYFYSHNANWNLYYGMPEVRYRLEAVLEHLLTLQNPDGTFSEYHFGENNLGGVSFAIQFLGQTIRLLNEAKASNSGFPFINEELFDRVIAATRFSLIRVLEDDRLWGYGRATTNKYTLVWSSVAAYLQYYPDTELESKMLARLEQSEDEFISPAGFYYESDAYDMGYNLAVHLQNLIGDYHYFKDTPLEQAMIDKESKFFEWLSYNLVLEPDGTYFTANSAVGSRNSSLTVDRKDIPLAEKLPLARVFVRTQEEVAADIAAAKEAITQDGIWPNVPELPLTGGNAYNPYGLYNRIMYNYHPTEAEKGEAIQSLPYIARDRFIHQRVDSADRSGWEFTYIRRPGYYATFNAGELINGLQVFGLGLLWHPEGGIMLSSKTEAQDLNATSRGYSWGTRAADKSRVYENGDVLAQYTIDGGTIEPAVGYGDLPEGELAVQYSLGNAGQKTVTYGEEGITVAIQHAGAFEERFPLTIASGDQLDISGNKITVTRGHVVLEIEFDREVEAGIEKASSQVFTHSVNMLVVSAVDQLSYTLTIFTQGAS